MTYSTRNTVATQIQPHRKIQTPFIKHDCMISWLNFQHMTPVERRLGIRTKLPFTTSSQVFTNKCSSVDWIKFRHTWHYPGYNCGRCGMGQNSGECEFRLLRQDGKEIEFRNFWKRAGENWGSHYPRSYIGILDVLEWDNPSSESLAFVAIPFSSTNVGY